MIHSIENDRTLKCLFHKHYRIQGCKYKKAGLKKRAIFVFPHLPSSPSLSLSLHPQPAINIHTSSHHSCNTTIMKTTFLSSCVLFAALSIPSTMAHIAISNPLSQAGPWTDDPSGQVHSWIGNKGKKFPCGNVSLLVFISLTVQGPIK